MSFRKISLNFLIALIAGLGAASIFGQNALSISSTGSIKGVLLADDTHRPIRFALVMLQSRRSADGIVTFTARTDVDGNFVLNDIVPGDYYVMATAQGYIGEQERLQTAIRAGTDPALLLAQIPTARVVLGSMTTVALMLEHGAAISGHVQWKDGSPAGSVVVTALPSAQGPWPLPAPLDAIEFPTPQTQLATTDDRGNFRLAGLPAGVYLLQSIVQSSSDANNRGRAPVDSFLLRMYAPGVMRLAEATKIEAVVGQERSDIVIVLDLKGTHSVAGHISTASDGEVTSGQVTLVDSIDEGLQFKTEVFSRGEFILANVPPGTYTLHIDAASNRRPGGIRYESFAHTIVVGDDDLKDLSFSLMPVQ